MKTNAIILALAATASFGTFAVADEVVRETVTGTQATVSTTAPIELAGTVSDFADSAVVIRSENTTAPVSYRFTKTTQWVDESGNVVTRETVKTGTPVTITYVKSPEGLVVSKVIVRRSGPRVVERSATVAPTVTQQSTTTTTTTKTKKDDDDDDDDD